MHTSLKYCMFFSKAEYVLCALRVNFIWNDNPCRTMNFLNILNQWHKKLQSLTCYGKYVYPFFWKRIQRQLNWFTIFNPSQIRESTLRIVWIMFEKISIIFINHWTENTYVSIIEENALNYTIHYNIYIYFFCCSIII